MNHEDIIKQLKKLSNPKNVEGMAKFGINPKYALGINIPVLRKTAKEILKHRDYKDSPLARHKLALNLWKSKLHEVKILACMVDTPEEVTEKQMEKWASDFDSWDIVDQTCSNLFGRTPFAYKKAFVWSKRKEEFVKRAGFVLMATLSVHDKKATDAKLSKFFPAIKREAIDERNFVRKAVNWALRQAGKRNKKLNKESIKLAREIEKMDSKSAKWIAKDALRELTSKNVQKKLA
jgi:3-methyladenine DNA glycosylase AlkD